MNLCFAAERTLGKLAKWLRILGFDTLYESDVSRQRFFEDLQAERILLTRTRNIRKIFAGRRMVFIESNYLSEQLKQVIDEVGVTFENIRPFSRCIQCNLPTAKVGKDAVNGLVPDYVYDINDTFNLCPRCKRIFWQGSHTERSMEIISRLFGFD